MPEFIFDARFPGLNWPCRIRLTFRYGPFVHSAHVQHAPRPSKTHVLKIAQFENFPTASSPRRRGGRWISPLPSDRRRSLALFLPNPASPPPPPWPRPRARPGIRRRRPRRGRRRWAGASTSSPPPGSPAPTSASPPISLAGDSPNPFDSLFLELFQKILWVMVAPPVSDWNTAPNLSLLFC